MDNKTATEGTGTKNSCISKYIQFIVSASARTQLPLFFLLSIILVQVSKTALTFLNLNSWQLSGYYLSALEYGLYLFLILSWVLSIIMLFFRHRYMEGFLRLLAIPLILFISAFVSLISNLFLPSMISGWPIDTVYSKKHQKYYILAYEPAFTDVCYRVFSTKKTLLNPKWRIEFAGNILDYSEDGSLTENPQLILSEDEELLVVKRGGHFTDAILVDFKQPLSNSVPWSDENREEQWKYRTDQIKAFLQKHSSKSKSVELQKPLTYPQIRTILKEYCQKLGEDLTEYFKEEGWIISCKLSEVDQDEIEIHTSYSVECSKGNKKCYFPRDMKLVDDHGLLIITEQDNGLLWSDDEEKMLCERVRDAIYNIAGEGTYIN